MTEKPLQASMKRQEVNVLMKEFISGVDFDESSTASEKSIEQYTTAPP